MTTEPMSIDRALLISFAVAATLAIICFFTDPSTLLGKLVGWGGSLSLVLLGILLGRAGHSYKTALANTWPFVLLFVFVGYLRVHIPGPYISDDMLREEKSYGWWIYPFFVVLALPFAFAWSAAGIWIAKKFWPLGNGGDHAA